MGQEYWSGLPFPPPRDLPNPGIEPTSLALAGRFFAMSHHGSPESITMNKGSGSDGIPAELFKNPKR